MRKIKVLVNKAARSGGDRRLLEIVAEEFSREDYEVIIPESYEDLCERARQAKSDGTDVVVVIGGDGTINAVVNQLACSGVALGIVPAGTANDLATHLGIPKDPREACQLIKRGIDREIDLAQINGKFFVTAGGTGVVSQVAVDVNWLKAKGGAIRRVTKSMGSLVYVLYSFVLLLFSRKIVNRIEVKCDDKDLGELRSIALFVNNQPSIGKTVYACPDTREDDGQLGVCVMTKRSRIGNILTVILMSLRGAHTRRKDIEILEGKTVQITSTVPRVFIGDGEVLAQTRNLSLSVVPKGLKVIS